MSKLIDQNLKQVRTTTVNMDDLGGSLGNWTHTAGHYGVIATITIILSAEIKLGWMRYEVQKEKLDGVTGKLMDDVDPMETWHGN